MPLRDIPLNHQFYISLYFDRKRYNYKVVKTKAAGQLEYFTLYARNRNIVFQSNRPLWRSRGANHRRIDWKLTEGEMNNMSFLEVLIEKINEYVKRYENETPGYVHPKNLH